MLSIALKRTANSIRIPVRNSCVSWARSYSATTATSSPLDQFRDVVSREKRTTEEVGRSWSVTELRRKNFDDLHKLWIVLYKEKNMLLTETGLCRTNGVYFPQKVRQQKVKKSMASIRTVLGERKRDKIAQSALKALEKADADNKQDMMALEKEADADHKKEAIEK